MILIYIYIRTATKRLHVTFRRIFSFCLLNFKSIIKNSKINRKVNMIMKKKEKIFSWVYYEVSTAYLTDRDKERINRYKQKKEGLFFLLCLNKKKTVYALIFLSPP